MNASNTNLAHLDASANKFNRGAQRVPSDRHVRNVAGIDSFRLCSQRSASTHRRDRLEVASKRGNVVEINKDLSRGARRGIAGKLCFLRNKNRLFSATQTRVCLCQHELQAEAFHTVQPNKTRNAHADAHSLTVAVASVGGSGAGGGAGGEPGVGTHIEPSNIHPRGICSRKRMAEASQKSSGRSLQVLFRHPPSSHLHAGFSSHRVELTRRTLECQPTAFGAKTETTDSQYTVCAFPLLLLDSLKESDFSKVVLNTIA